MRHLENTYQLSKSIVRDIQVLDRINGKCPICSKDESLYLIWLFEKDRLPIFFLFGGISRFYTEGYGVWCNSCNVLNNFYGKSPELSKKYEQMGSGKHKIALEKETKFVETKFIKKK